MKYEKLRIISYSDSGIVGKEHENRLNSPSTIRTDFFIHPFVNGYRKSEVEYELFYVYQPSHVLMMQEIMTNSNEMTKLSNSIKGIARHKIMLSHIVQEIQGTNETEGVRSTKEEISKAVKGRNSKKNIRFKGIANMYFNIYENISEPIEAPIDLKNIYDSLFSEEISDKDKPDGKIFRKSSVSIMDGTEVVHRGNPDEESILLDVGKLINLMNDKKIPYLIKCVISHYILEYIHPFYDGNGRLGRYVISQYLSRKLDFFSGISISNSVNKSKKKYSDAFSEVSELKNYGELTFFVDMMLKLILKGQKEVIVELSENKKKLKYYNDIVVKMNLSEDAKNVLFVLIQDNEFRHFAKDMTDEDISKSLGISRYRVNNAIKGLITEGYIERVCMSPSQHGLTNKFMEKIS